MSWTAHCVGAWGSEKLAYLLRSSISSLFSASSVECSSFTKQFPQKKKSSSHLKTQNHICGHQSTGNVHKNRSVPCDVPLTVLCILSDFLFFISLNKSGSLKWWLFLNRLMAQSAVIWGMREQIPQLVLCRLMPSPIMPVGLAERQTAISHWVRWIYDSPSFSCQLSNCASALTHFEYLLV